MRAGAWTGIKVLITLRELSYSHRLRGLPPSSGSPSLLHLRALAPEKHIASFRQGTVEPQPPPHAQSGSLTLCRAWMLRWSGNLISQCSHLSLGSESLPSSPQNRCSIEDRPILREGAMSYLARDETENIPKSYRHGVLTFPGLNIDWLKS